MFSYQVLKEMAFGLVGIYVPILLYTHGVSLFHIVALFTLQSATHGTMTFVAGRSVLLRLGLKHSFVVASFFFIGAFIVLQYGVSLEILLLWALCSGTANALYASTYHSYLALTIDRRSAGQEIAWLAILVTIVDIAMPFVGALSILLFGFNNMLAVGSVLLLASVVPLFFSREIDTSRQIHLKGAAHLKAFWSARKEIAWSTVGKGFDGASNPLWDSLYIYKLLGGIESLGILTSVVSLLQIVSNYVGGRRMDAKKSAFGLGISGSIFARVLTFASFHPYIAIMSESANYAIKPLFDTAYNAAFYKRLRGDDTISMVIAHENTWHAAHVCAMVVITIGTYFFGWYAFLITGVFMIIGKLIVRAQRVGALEQAESARSSV